MKAAMASSERHARPTLLSDFILGSEDGIVNVLGIILGLAAAIHDARIIIIATLAAMAAESIAMGAVAYTSTRSRRRLYLAETERELREMRDLPDVEREEVRTILKEWGYEGDDLNEMLRLIEKNPKAMLELMMAFELKLAPVEEVAPRNVQRLPPIVRVPKYTVRFATRVPSACARSTAVITWPAGLYESMP